MTENKNIQPVQENGSTRLADLIKTPAVQERFKEVLKDKAPIFLSNLLVLVNGNENLKKAEPMSVLSAAMIAASLDLSLNPSLGHAYIVPYKNVATFQLGYLGYVQLFIRSGQASRIHACAVKEGQLKSINSFTGEYTFQEQKVSDKTIGYLSYFRLTNGFEKQFYMSVEEIVDHAKRYSQAYRYDCEHGTKYSRWSTDFDAMAFKTVTKLNLRRHAPLSVEMQKAITFDDAVEINGEIKYPDSTAETEEAKNEEPVEEKKKTTSKRLAKALSEQEQPATSQFVQDTLYPNMGAEI